MALGRVSRRSGRLTNARVWIVDPIDGTKALVNRMPEYCISAALIEPGAPIVAAILNPSTDELFTQCAAADCS